MKPRTPKLRVILNFLTGADLVFILMPALMLILIAGTLAQRSIGLYAAQKTFFSSLIFWFGPLPLPGGMALLSLLTVSLALKFLLRSEWSWRKAGIILTHLGVLVLLTGGLLTALTAREGFMAITEGQESSYIYDYNKRELFIFENDTLRYALPFKTLGEKINLDLPFTLKAISKCAHCAIQRREGRPAESELRLRGMAQFMALESKPEQKEPERNLPGASLEITGAGTDIDGLYVAFEAMPKPIEFETEGRNYKIIFGRQQRTLPFALLLKDFRKDDYPGTEMARGYSSDLVVKDGALEWPVHIEMNQPLRYKGYTFYQSSFDQRPGDETTVLSVVENKGRLFPYLGTLIIAAGLLLHVFTAAERKP